MKEERRRRDARAGALQGRRVALVEGVGAPVYDMDMIAGDPTYEARRNIVTVEDPELGPLRMQNVVPAMSATPGEVRWSGPALGTHNQAVYGDLLGLPASELERLRHAGVI